MGIGRFVYTPILPFMADALALTKGQSGLIAAANFFGYFVGSLIGATGFLRGDPRAWALGGLAASGLATGAMALTTSIPAFLVLRFIGGGASALVMVFASAIVFERLAAAGRPNLSHLHFAGVGIGMSVSAVLVSGLAAGHIGWAGQWIATGTVTLAAFVAVAFMFPRSVGDDGSRDDGTPPETAAEKTFDRRIIPLVLSYGLFGFGYVVTATFISVMVRQTPSIATIEPVVWLVVGLAAVPSVAFWAWIGRRLGNPASIALACLVESAGVAATVSFDSAAAVLIGAALLGGTFMGITAVGMMTAREMSRGDPRRMLAMIVCAFGTGQMIGPAFAGYVAEITGDFTAPTLIASGALIVSAGLAMMLTARRSAAPG
ncbi:MAG: YbfB/YjiJ family MFS transporter [Rhodospirillales bacterium]|nr:YbfB/YjiJ family MFS transporter [Rhodospirillales bacterium]